MNEFNLKERLLRLVAFIYLFSGAKKAQGAIIGIISSIVIIGLGSVVGLTIIAKGKDVYDGMALAAAANTAMSSTTSTLYGIWPMIPLIALALIGAAVIGAFMVFRG